MSVTEPPNDDDEIFRRLTEDIDIDPTQISTVVVSSLTDYELMQKFSQSRNELVERGCITEARNDTERELHSVYHAAMLEMRKRGLMGRRK